MNILHKTTGHFKFILTDDTEVEYNDLRDIPEDLDIMHVLKYLPDVPPEPHTAEDHALIVEFIDNMNKYMEKEREYWRNHASSN